MLTLRHDAKLGKAVCDVLVTLEKLRINIQIWHYSNLAFITLLSPLLCIYELYMVAAYLTIPTSTTLKTVTATNNRQGYVRVARPIQEATVRAIA